MLVWPPLLPFLVWIERATLGCLVEALTMQLSRRHRDPAAGDGPSMVGSSPPAPGQRARRPRKSLARGRRKRLPGYQLPARGAILVTSPINDELLAALRALPSRLTSPWVFPNAAGTGPLAADTWVRRVFKPALRAAGIRNFRWKDLRHTYATRLNARNGVGMKTIATLLGHTTTRMTERYTHASADLLSAVRGIGGVQNAEVVAPKAPPRTKRAAR